MKGPESIATDGKGNLYTGSIGGNIYRISNNGAQIDLLVNIRADGRPLGIRVDTDDDNLLHVLDAFVGIYTINIKSKSISLMYNMTDDTIDHGRQMLFIDDFVKVGNKLYITDSMAGFTESSAFLAVISYDTSGRVIEFDTVTKKVTELSTGIAFPNGIELTDDGDLLVVELTRHTLWRVNIKEKRRVKVIDNLPGWADNIRRSTRRDRETHWIAFFNTADNLKRISILSDKPTLAKYVCHLVYNLAKGAQFVSEQLKSLQMPQLQPVSQFFEQVAFNFESGTILLAGVPDYGLVIEVDAKTGEIIQSLHSPNGAAAILSEARDVIEGDSRVLYLGSAFNDYIGKVILGKVDTSKGQPDTGKSKVKSAETTSSTTTTTGRPRSSTVKAAEVKATESKRKKESTSSETTASAAAAAAGEVERGTTASSTNNGESVNLSKTKKTSDSVSSESTAKSTAGKVKENADKGSNK